MKPEILAPSGNFEALTAAVRAGADAVYFGTGDFNARRNAANFCGDELFKASDFCHSHGVKFYITLNTLVLDNELSEVKKTLERVCKANADALILQDLGVAKLARQMCPDTELHASTQLSTGTLEGIKLLEKAGFCRAVLPRELSENEIKYLCDNSPLSLEMFVHGALCMCVSGQCLLSSMLGSRSGNRGLCAQPCRLEFSADGGTGRDLSLKDLSLIEDINKLGEMGISSFKIEGRMKRPEYVAAAVAACKKALNGIYTDNDKNELKALFSRSGFTKGYFEGKLGKDMFGYREKENVQSATTELMKKYAKLYEKEKSVFSVEFIFSAFENEAVTLSASANGINVFVQSDIKAEKAINRPLTEDAVKTQLLKCGGTVFEPENIECELGENISVPMSAINALRRKALEKLSEQIINRKKNRFTDAEYSISPHKSADTPKKYLCFRNTENIPESFECDKVFLPLGTPTDIIKKYNAGVIVPRGILGNSDKITEMLKVSDADVALCNTLDAVAAAKNANINILGGPSLNILNSISLEEAKNIGICECVLSYELTIQQISKLGGDIGRGAVVYGKTPLMLTRNCPIKNGISCNECKGKSSLVDRKGIRFPVICSNGFSELFNSRPTYMADRLNEFKNIDFYVFDFTNESKQKISYILDLYKHTSPPDGEFTRGLYYRGVL